MQGDPYGMFLHPMAALVPDGERPHTGTSQALPPAALGGSSRGFTNPCPHRAGGAMGLRMIPRLRWAWLCLGALLAAPWVSGGPAVRHPHPAAPGAGSTPSCGFCFYFALPPLSPCSLGILPRAMRVLLTLPLLASAKVISCIPPVSGEPQGARCSGSGRGRDPRQGRGTPWDAWAQLTLSMARGTWGGGSSTQRAPHTAPFPRAGEDPPVPDGHEPRRL